MKKEFYARVRWTLSVGFLKGFSLIELLMSLALLSVVLAVAFPSFSSLLTRLQLDSDVSAIRAGLSFSRMAALSKNKQVIACRWDGINNCTGDAGLGTLVWQMGLLVYIDIDENKIWTPLVDQQLKIIPFTLSNNIIWNNGEKVIFQPNGSSPGYNGTFTLTDGNGVTAALLVLSRTGRLRYQSPN
ncbi:MULTISPECIES: GspH/FimT family pseudopilin [unclassified Neptuniibacter]|uniref:GspH/FimT family pseudopilin n=1 Tax=unclassified Neptuniibacter TaxID=2630693 RepID=UPI000C59B92C|nr:MULTISPECIES: GspH/FimT family pseudopilin [unclassified Neptuniibacter]MAY42814.1 hypothetical protein [Oceanospirillaceae bacterium]|tara:strand:- start:6544 stop:7101 length:558 start_codon:yes stop_codon:yes gene_type:complete